LSNDDGMSVILTVEDEFFISEFETVAGTGRLRGGPNTQCRRSDSGP
jgi:hypothetical protein